ASLTFSTEPTNTFTGVAITPAVLITVKDAIGNTVTGYNNNVTVAVGTNPGGDTLSGTKTIAAVAGIATFADLRFSQIGTGYTLTATSGSLPAVTSSAFTITGWTARGAMPTPRTGLRAAVVNDLIYAVGGSTADGMPSGVVEVYDPAGNGWATRARMPTPRSLLGVGVVNGVLYAVGGFTTGGASAVLEAYDPVANTWTTKASMPTARAQLGVAVVNGILYAVGGANG